MSHPIEALLRFQEKDRVRAELARERAGVPDQLEAAEAKLRVRQDAEQKAQVRYDEVRMSKERAELDAEAEAARIAEREIKLRQVRTNEEFQAGMRELTEQRKHKNAFEEIALARMEELEEVGKELEAARAAREAEEATVQEIRDSVETRLAELDAKIEAAKADAASLEPQVDSYLLSLYKRVADSIHDDPIVEVVSGTCRGCFMGVPMQIYNELHHPNVFHACPSCHRILFVKIEEVPAEASS